MSNHGDDVPNKKIRVKRVIPQISMEKYSGRLKQHGDRIRQPVAGSARRERELLMKGLVDESASAPSTLQQTPFQIDDQFHNQIHDQFEYVASPLYDVQNLDPTNTDLQKESMVTQLQVSPARGGKGKGLMSRFMRSSGYNFQNEGVDGGEDEERDEEEEEEEEEEVFVQRRLGKGKGVHVGSSMGGERSNDKRWLLFEGIDGGPNNTELIKSFGGHVAYFLGCGEVS